MVANRRALNNSSEDSAIDSGYGLKICTIEDWVAAKDGFRITATGHARCAPFVNKPCSQRVADIFTNQVKTQVKEILNDCKIGFDLISTRYRWTNGYPEQGKDTLLIETSNEDTKSWKKAAQKIMNTLWAWNLTDKDLEIEICNPRRMYSDVSYILPDDKVLLKALESVRGALVKAAALYLRGTWSSIAFHMRGPRSRDSLARPTVMVFCRPGFVQNFYQAEEEIFSVLSSLEINIQLEFLPGVAIATEPGYNDPIAIADFNPVPKNGSSIGTIGNHKSAGSLGAWVFWNSPKLPQPVKCFLTCYHVIAPEEPSLRAELDKNGIGLRGQEKTIKLRVQYPGHSDVAATENLLKQKLLVASTTDTKHKVYLEAFRSHMLDPSIGKVIFASGVQMNKRNRRMDWALVESPNFFGKNKPPEDSKIEPQYMMNNNPYLCDLDFAVRNIGQIERGSWLCKSGRSGVSTGEVNRIDATVNWEQHKDLQSQEVEVIPFGGPPAKEFASPGDSGSMVLNTRKEYAGMIIGKQNNAHAENGVFVTPISDIMEHIKEQTGGFISLEL